MGAVVVLSLVAFLTGGIISNNTEEEMGIPVNENLYENWNTPNGSYFVFEKGKYGKRRVRHESPKDFDKVLSFYKRSIESGRINTSVELSCFKDGKPSANYLRLGKAEVDVLRNLVVGTNKRVLYQRADVFKNGYYSRQYHEIKAEKVKIESKECIIHIDRDFKLRDFFLLRSSVDSYWVISERYF